LYVSVFVRDDRAQESRGNGGEGEDYYWVVCVRIYLVLLPPEITGEGVPDDTPGGG